MDTCSCPEHRLGMDHLEGCPCRIELRASNGIKQYRIGKGDWVFYDSENLPLKVGLKYWCLSSSSESSGYGKDELQEPWLGVLDERRNPGGIVFRLCAWGREGADTDSNASCYITPLTPLFETLQEAKTAYVSLKLQEIHDEMAVSVNKLHVLKQFMLKEGITSA